MNSMLLIILIGIFSTLLTTIVGIIIIGGDKKTSSRISNKMMRLRIGLQIITIILSIFFIMIYNK
jgi:hypothetical protein